MTEIETATPAKPANPWKSPSYPQRVHIRERPHWQGVLNHWRERVTQARQELTSGGANPNRQRLFAQMLGALDQIEDAARRLPLETGDLYAQDRTRLEQAVSALERLFTRWS